MDRSEFEIEQYLRRYMWQHPLLGLERKPDRFAGLRFVGDLPVSFYDSETQKSWLIAPAGPIWERLMSELKEELSSGRDQRLMQRCDRMVEEMLREYMWAHPFEGAKPKEAWDPKILWVGDVPVVSLGGPDGFGFLPFGRLWHGLSLELEAEIANGSVPRPPPVGSSQSNSA